MERLGKCVMGVTPGITPGSVRGPGRLRDLELKENIASTDVCIRLPRS